MPFATPAGMPAGGLSAPGGGAGLGAGSSPAAAASGSAVAGSGGGGVGSPPQPTSTASPLLGQRAPERLQVAYSHAPHPYPQPDFAPLAISPASNATKAALEVARIEAAKQLQAATSRGAGFSAVASRAARRRTLFPAEEVQHAVVSSGGGNGGNGGEGDEEAKSKAPATVELVASSVMRRASAGVVSFTGLAAHAAPAAVFSTSPRPMLLRAQSVATSGAGSPRSPSATAGASAAAAAASSIAAVSIPALPAFSTASPRSQLSSTRMGLNPLRSAAQASESAAADANSAAADAATSYAPADVVHSLRRPASQRDEADIALIEAWFRGLSLPFFAEVDKETMLLLAARMHLRSFAPGEIVMREGTVSDALFILLQGEVSVWNEQVRDREALDELVDRSHHLHHHKRSATPQTLMELIVHLGGRPRLITHVSANVSSKIHPLFGELGLLTEQMRTATIIAHASSQSPPAATPTLGATPSISPGTAAVQSPKTGLSPLLQPLSPLLLSAHVSAASAATTAPAAEFLLIDKSDFDAALKQRQSERFAAKLAHLRSLRALRSISEKALVKLSFYFHAYMVPPHAVVIEQGSVADKVLFLVEGEVEVREWIAIGGGGGGGNNNMTKPGSSGTTAVAATAVPPSRTSVAAAGCAVECVHLGLLGPGELLSDAAVFEATLLHPWELVTRASPALVYAISSDELARRLRSDILSNLRRLAFAKKELREQLRNKAHQAMQHGNVQSPRIKQAQKLLAQVLAKKKTSVGAAATSSAFSSAGVQMPRKIQDTLVKNVVQAHRTQGVGDESGADSPGSYAAATAIRPGTSAGGLRVVAQLGPLSRPSTTQTSTLNSSAALDSSSSATPVVRTRKAPAPAVSAQLLRPSTSPASSTAAASSASLDDDDDDEHAGGGGDKSRVRFAATATTLSVIVAPDTTEEQAAELIETLVAEAPLPLEKGNLLVQRNPFAYDESSWSMPLSSSQHAAGPTTMPVASPPATPNPLKLVSPRAARHHTSSPVRRPYVHALPTASADAPRLSYPFDHVYAGAAGAEVSAAALSVYATISPRDSNKGTPAHARSLSLRGSLTLPDSELIELSTKSPEAVPPRDPRAAQVLASQIKGHRRQLSRSHRGSVTAASLLPFALEGGVMSGTGAEGVGHSTIALGPPLPPAHQHPSMASVASAITAASSQSGGDATISAPVLVLPSSSGATAAGASLSSVVSSGTGELIAPVPSFAHKSANFYRDQVPHKQYYGKLDFQRAVRHSHGPGGATAASNQAQHSRERASMTQAQMESLAEQLFPQPTALLSSAAGAKSDHSGLASKRMLTETISEGGRCPSPDAQASSRLGTPQLLTFVDVASRSASRPLTAQQPHVSLQAHLAAQADPPVMAPSASSSPAPQDSVQSSASSLHHTQQQTPSSGPSATAILARVASPRGVGGGDGMSNHHRSPTRRHGRAPQTAIAVTGGAGTDSSISSKAEAEMEADELGLFDAAILTSAAGKPSRRRVLAEATMKALLSDPLMLQKEDVKWARQMQAWGRTLVVPPSSFMPGAREAAEKALQLRSASSAAGVAASADGNSGTVPASTSATLSLHGASLSDALRLTPANVEVFTTRPASELSSMELASPLLLVPRAAPLVSSGGLSYLYPTARETGSIAQTRELGAALDNLQDAIATGFADPKLTRGRSAAREAEKRSEAAMHLAEELALQRLHNRRIMPEELIGRLSYAPRAEGGAMMVSTAQAQRRHALLASSGALGRGISLSGPVTQHRSNHGSGSDFAQAARARRKANLDAGQALGKTPRQRHRARQEMERKLREEEEEKRRQEQSDSPGTRHSRAASPDKVGAAAPTAAALLQPPSLSARDALTIPLPVDEMGMPPPLDSALYESVRLAEQEAVVLRYATDVLNRSDGMWLRTLLQPPTPLAPARPQPSTIAEVVSASATPLSTRRTIVGIVQPTTPRGTAAARGHHRQRSSSSVSPQRRTIHAETPSETYTPVEAAVPSTAPAASPTFAAFHAARPLPGAPALAGPPQIAASSASRAGGGGIGGAAGPALSGEQRVLHSGALELSRDVELEYGREWRFFEDRLPSQRAEVLQRAMQAAAAAAADDAEDDGTQQARNIQQSLQQSRTEQAGSPMGASEGSKHARKATEFIEHALWCQAAETEEAADDSEREQHPSIVAAAGSSTPVLLLRPSISRSSPRSSEPRTLVALTPLGDEGVTVLLGSQAPRLYHWAAMLDTATLANGGAEQQSSVSNAATAVLASPTSDMPVLSVDALTRSLRAEVPQPPPASLSALSLPEPTLSQLTYEIATYRRDLRLLRKNMHSGHGTRPSSSPHSSGLGSGVLSVIRPFTPGATHNGSAVVTEVASFARPEVLAQRAAKEAALARRRERDLRGSSAPAIQKMLRLRRYQEGPLVALAARAGRRGQQPNHHRPGSILLEEDELLAAATADGGGGGALLSSMGVQTSRTAEEEQAQAAKRFWRQNYKPRTAGSSIQRTTAMTPRKLEGAEEKTANTLPLIDSYIKGPAVSAGVDNAACLDALVSLPRSEGSVAASTFASLSPSFSLTTPGVFSASSNSSTRGVGSVYTPRLSDVLHKLTQPVPVELLSDSQQALSARSAMGAKQVHAVGLRA